MIRPRIGRLGRDEQGSALTEFGLLAPVLIVLLLGAFDMGHSLYARSVLEGSLQKAARDSSLETGTVAENQAVIDNLVRGQMNDIGIDNEDITIRRRYYRSFSAASAANAEPYTDNNHNNKCDNGEPYEDRNNNSTRDVDGGDAGQGGAEDTVLYTVTLNFKRLFPIANFIGLSDREVIQASTVMNNQPYGEQGSYAAATTRHCPA